MFTGLVETCGAWLSLEEGQDSRRLRLKAELEGEVVLGESIAVNGCCLSVCELGEGGLYGFDILDETLRCTNLGDLGPQSCLNLERALRADARLGGHFVSGHVDGTARVQAFEQEGQNWRLSVEPPPELLRYFVRKGSVAIDGVSLTVGEVTDTTFCVWLIPHTLEVTNLSGLAAGSRVNLEVDLLARYAEKLLEVRS